MYSPRLELEERPRRSSTGDGQLLFSHGESSYRRHTSSPVLAAPVEAARSSLSADLRCSSSQISVFRQRFAIVTHKGSLCKTCTSTIARVVQLETASSDNCLKPHNASVLSTRDPSNCIATRTNLSRYRTRSSAHFLCDFVAYPPIQREISLISLDK